MMRGNFFFTFFFYATSFAIDFDSCYKIGPTPERRRGSKQALQLWLSTFAFKKRVAGDGCSSAPRFASSQKNIFSRKEERREVALLEALLANYVAHLTPR
jgi:hypothetical protein